MFFVFYSIFLKITPTISPIDSGSLSIVDYTSITDRR